MNRLFWIFTALAVLFMSCNNGEIIQGLNQNKMNKTYSDRDVFMGVIFLHGPVSHRLSIFKQLSFINQEKDSYRIKERLAFQKK